MALRSTKERRYTPNFDVLVDSVSLQDMFPSYTHSAKAMEDWLLKPTDSGELGQNLEIGQIIR